MRHPSGLEINLIVNASTGSAPNILMDVPEKHSGFTHVALEVADLEAVEAILSTVGVAVTGRRGSAPAKALFVRDPDGNVIELATD